MRNAVLLLTHTATLVVGVALGIYLLPILIAPAAPDLQHLQQRLVEPHLEATFARERTDSDALHWGSGQLSWQGRVLWFAGELAPGPDYRLYLTPEYVETEADFLRIKQASLEVGAVRSFDGFVFDNAPDAATTEMVAAVVWCETFSQFITSGRFL